MRRTTRKPKTPKKSQKKEWGGTKKRKTQKGGKQTMRCHPSISKDKKVHSDSCLTHPLLEKIKETYNQKHPKHPLLANEPRALYQEISDKFANSCKEEKCWIRQLLHTDSDKILNKFYSPTSPSDWKKNPVEWLSNFDIEAVMNQYEEAHPEFEFLGPVPIDFDSRTSKGDESTCVSRDVCSLHLKQKVNQGKTKIGIVFNLSPSTSSGSHWVSLYIHLPDLLLNKKRPRTHGGEEWLKQGGFLEDMGSETGGELDKEGGKGQPWGKETAYCFFFDSAGDTSPKEVKQLIKRLQKEWKNDKHLNPQGTEMYYDCNHRTKADHQQGNTECGVYSLFFLTTMLTGKCAGGVLENGEWKQAEECAVPLKEEQDKVDYFQGKEKDRKGGRLLIPDEFMVKLRKYYFNPHP